MDGGLADVQAVFIFRSWKKCKKKKKWIGQLQSKRL
jgi:hypothetical protein